MDYFWFVIFGSSDVFVFLVFGIYFDSDDFFQLDNVIVFISLVVDMDLLVCDYKCIFRWKEFLMVIWMKVILQLYFESYG